MARIIYLSGTMEGKSFEIVKTQRDKAVRKLTDAGFLVCDPLRHKDKHFRGGKAKMNLSKSDYEIQQIIGRDENDIRQSDALIVLTGDNPSSGTWFEFAFAYYVVKIPVIVVAPSLRRNMDAHGSAYEWTGGKATKVVRNLDEAVKVLEWLYGKRYEMPHSDVRDLP